MYRPAAFAVDDVAQLQAFIRDRAFATLVRIVDGATVLAYAPVLFDAQVGKFGALRVHFSTNNSIAEGADGAQFRVSFLGPDAYISPDWYESTGKVPTWNYIAVEAQGVARRLNDGELRRLLVDLSAQHEEPLRPKKPWTIDKVPPQRLAALTNAIQGFEIRLESLEGKFKLSQNIDAADREGVLRGLDVRGDAASDAVAAAMRAATAP